jgi:hypothetical protein
MIEAHCRCMVEVYMLRYIVGACICYIGTWCMA